jgi:hypothetical protein
MSMNFRISTAALGLRTVAPVGAADSGRFLPFTI